MKIGIIGYGYVGKSIESFFISNVDTIIYDNKFNGGDSYLYFDSTKNVFTNNFDLLKDCDFVFICVPTPESADGSCDTSIVTSCLEDLYKIKYKGIVIIKSTVPVGFTDGTSDKYKFSIVFSPEFAGENKYISNHKFLKDIKESQFFIFGGNPLDTHKAVQLFQSIGGPEKKYIECDAKSAEMMKLMNNSFFALKVAFCNEMFDICNAYGLYYSKVRELWLLDPRNTPDFTLVFEDNRGFGGKCFPKDISSLINVAKKEDADSLILEAAKKSNNKVRNKND